VQAAATPCAIDGLVTDECSFRGQADVGDSTQHPEIARHSRGKALAMTGPVGL